MAQGFKEPDFILIKFGGGIHSRASEDQIDIRECKDGKNFRLDLQNAEYRNRPPFDLIGTAPNGGSVNGFITLLHTDGTVTLLVQAGANVYSVDSNYDFTLITSVNSSAKLRGRIEHAFQLDDIVIVTDINLQQPVMSWDGTTLQNISFTKEDDSAFGTFKAKYCYVSKERAVFANVESNGTITNHLIVGSKRGDYDNISVAQRPASALSEEDPFFLIQPDYRSINGLIESFGQVITSSERGSLFKLTGESAKDFSFDQLYYGSGASGDESLVYVGNDIFYGRTGRIESVRRTDQFGDVETDDLSKDISDSLEGFDDWLSVYNSRNQNVYFFEADQSECWVLHKPLLESDVSPWMRYTTLHASSFQPTAAMNAYDPADGLEYVFFGDAQGNVYKMEGSGTGDGGSADLQVERLSKLVSAPLDGAVYNIEGFVKHRKDKASTLTLKFEYAGESIFNESVTVNLPAATGGQYYNDSNYYNDGNYYAVPFAGKLRREKFGVAGASNEFQVRASIEGTETFEINEILLRFTVAKV